MMDDLDLRLLKLLQTNGRMSNADLARKIGLTPSATLERVRKLERTGWIRGYEARLDPVALGLGQVAFVFVRSREQSGGVRAAQRLAAIPEVLEVHHIAGEDCLLVKVRAANTESLGKLLRRRFGAIPWVQSTRTTIVLETVKEGARLPVPVHILSEEHHGRR